jgi:serine/threonine protein kinase
LHRNLKADQYFNHHVTSDFSLSVLSDLSFSKQTLGEVTKFKVHDFNHFEAPECILGEEYTEKSEIWALGCIMYMALTKKMPFQGKSVYQISKSILNDDPVIPSTFSMQTKTLLSWMLSKDPHARPSLMQILCYPTIYKELIDYYVAEKKIYKDVINERFNELIKKLKEPSVLSSY